MKWKRKETRRRRAEKTIATTKTHRNNYAIIWKWTQKKRRCTKRFARMLLLFLVIFPPLKPSSTSHAHSEPLPFFCALLRFPSCFELNDAAADFNNNIRTKREAKTPNSYNRPEHISPICRWIIIPIFFVSSSLSLYLASRLEFVSTQKKNQFTRNKSNVLL